MVLSVAPRVSFRTLGCKVNAYDTAAMAERLRTAGCEIVPPEAAADVVIVNTCTVTDTADAESRRLARRVRRLNPAARLIVTGCYAQTKPDEVAGYYREVLDRRRRALGPSHPEVANAVVNLAGALGRGGQYEESIRLYRDGLAMRRTTQGDDHPEIGVDLVGLADIYRLAGDSAATTRSYREALARLRRTHGLEHPLTRKVAGRVND
jgi:hypothetical protein